MNENNFILLPIPINASEFHFIHNKTRIAYFYPKFKRFDLPENCEFEIIGKLSEILNGIELSEKLNIDNIDYLVIKVKDFK